MRNNMFFAYAALLLVLFITATGCSDGGNRPQTTTADTVVANAPIEANPQGAAEEILLDYEDRVVETLNGADLLSVMGINSGDTYYFLAYYSDPDNGLCDMVFISPVDGQRDQLREALYAYKEKRTEQFENYDILDSLNIAENAVVVDQGEYLVLLMLPDNDKAREIIDAYIPQ